MSDPGVSPLSLAILSGQFGSSNGSPSGGFDPATMTAIPRLNLAQQMMQQGVSGEPTSPFGAAGRLFSAFAGRHMFDQAASGLSQIYANEATALQKAFPADHPIQKFLASPDFPTRMQGVEAAKQMLQSMGVPQKMGPNESLMYGNGGIAGSSNLPITEAAKSITDAHNPAIAAGDPSAQTILNSAALKTGEIAPGIIATPNGAQPIAPNLANLQGSMAGQSASASAPGEAQKAGAVAGATATAESRFKEGGNITLQMPDGTWRQIPVTAQNRAALQNLMLGNLAPSGAQSGSSPSAMPSGLPTPAQSPASASGQFGENDAAGILQKLIPGVSITSQQRSPVHNAEVGGVPDSKHLSGQAVDFVLPKGVSADQLKAQLQQQGFPVTEFLNEGDHVHWGWGAKGGQQTAAATPRVMGNPLPNTAINPLVTEDAKEVAADRAVAAKNQQDMALVQQIRDLMPKVHTGWSASERLEVGRVLQSAGMDSDTISRSLATPTDAAQLLQKSFVQLSAAAARNMGAREPGSVISMFQKAYPSLGTDPRAIDMMTNALYMAGKRQNDLAVAKTNYLNESVNGVQGTGRYRGLAGFNEEFNQAAPAENYMHAAEAMSHRAEVWQAVKDPKQRTAILNLIPSGTPVLLPDGSVRIKP